MTALYLEAERVAMYKAARMEGLPPQTDRLPRYAPLSRLSGATPTRAATWPRFRLPNSGRCASNIEESTGPTPGTLRTSSSRARHMGHWRIILSMSLSRSSICFSSHPMCLWIWGRTRLEAMRRRFRSEVQQLVPTVHQATQLSSLFIGQGPNRWLDNRSKLCQHMGVDHVCLCRSACCPSEVAHLPRIDHRYRQPSQLQFNGDQCLVSTGRLQHYPGGLHGRRILHKRHNPIGIVRVSCHLTVCACCNDQISG